MIWNSLYSQEYYQVSSLIFECLIFSLPLISAPLIFANLSANMVPLISSSGEILIFLPPLIFAPLYKTPLITAPSNGPSLLRAAFFCLGEVDLKFCLGWKKNEWGACGKMKDLLQVAKKIAWGNWGRQIFAWGALGQHKTCLGSSGNTLEFDLRVFRWLLKCQKFWKVLKG